MANIDSADNTAAEIIRALDSTAVLSTEIGTGVPNIVECVGVVCPLWGVEAACCKEGADERQ